jgi:hypothetical protein
MVRTDEEARHTLPAAADHGTDVDLTGDCGRNDLNEQRRGPAGWGKTRK